MPSVLLGTGGGVLFWYDVLIGGRYYIYIYWNDLVERPTDLVPDKSVLFSMLFSFPKKGHNILIAANLLTAKRVQNTVKRRASRHPLDTILDILVGVVWLLGCGRKRFSIKSKWCTSQLQSAREWRPHQFGDGENRSIYLVVFSEGQLSHNARRCNQTPTTSQTPQDQTSQDMIFQKKTHISYTSHIFDLCLVRAKELGLRVSIFSF